MTDLLLAGPMSETDAINYMLSAIGEAPILNINTATQADVAIAINLLKASIREVLMMKWTFNTEFGYRLEPAGQIAWTNPNSSSAVTLNVFEVPNNLLTYRLTPSNQQVGPLYPDILTRRAIYFQDPNVAGDFPIVFYDRALNREGFLASAYPQLVLDTVWYMDWSELPEEAKLYMVAHAARQLVERSVNASEISQFVKTDEAYAYRHLRRAWGLRDNYNMLRSVNAAKFYGFRPVLNAGFIDQRGQVPSQAPVTQDTTPTFTFTPSSYSLTASVNVPFTHSFVVTNPDETLTDLTFWLTGNAIPDGTVVTQAGVSPAGQFSLAPSAAGTNTQTLTLFGLATTAGTGSVTLQVLNSNQAVVGTATVTVTAS